MKTLGVFIANGFASEARVAASLWRHAGGRHDPCALHHCWSGDRESAARFEAASGARTFRFDAGWRPNPRSDRTVAGKAVSWTRLHLVLPRLIAEARRFRPEVVYSSQQIWDCYVAAWISRLLRVPQVIHLHYTVGPWLGRSTLRQLRHCERVVTVSEFIRGEALRHGVADGRAVTLLNAVAVPPSPPAERLEALRHELDLVPGQPVVAIAARLDPGKGHADVLAAFGAAAAKLPSARLLVAGEGSIRAEIEAEVEARGLRDSVRMLGFRKDVDVLLALADVFIHPSLCDPCPLGVLEAAAAGKPVVAYADGGIPEIVAHGETGLLVHTGDREALAGALRQLLQDPATRARMGAAARRRIAEQFRPAVAGERFAEIVSEVAAAEAPA